MKEKPETGLKVLIQHSEDASILVQNVPTTIQHKEVGKQMLLMRRLINDMYFFPSLIIWTVKNAYWYSHSALN